MAILAIQQAISDLRAEIIADAAVSASIASRLYRILAPQNGVLPYGVLNVITHNPVLSHDGDAAQSVITLQVDLYDTTVHGVMTAADAVKSKLIGLTTTRNVTRIQVGILSDETTGYEDETEYFRVRLDFTVILRIADDSYYFRPGGVDQYFRPGGVDRYIRA